MNILPEPHISLRDWFAGHALSAILSTELSDVSIADRAYSIADAMLAEREKTIPNLEPDSPKEKEALMECNIRLHANEQLIDQLAALSQERDAMKEELLSARVFMVSATMQVTALKKERDALKADLQDSERYVNCQSETIRESANELDNARTLLVSETATITALKKELDAVTQSEASLIDDLADSVKERDALRIRLDAAKYANGKLSDACGEAAIAFREFEQIETTALRFHTAHVHGINAERLENIVRTYDQ